MLDFYFHHALASLVQQRMTRCRGEPAGGAPAPPLTTAVLSLHVVAYITNCTYSTLHHCRSTSQSRLRYLTGCPLVSRQEREINGSLLSFFWLQDEEENCKDVMIITWCEGLFDVRYLLHITPRSRHEMKSLKAH